MVEETGQGRWLRVQRAQGSDVAIAPIPSVGSPFLGWLPALSEYRAGVFSVFHPPFECRASWTPAGQTLSKGTKFHPRSKSDTDLSEPSTFHLNCWTKRELSLPFFQPKELSIFLPSLPLFSLLLSVLMMLVAPFKGPWTLPRTKDLSGSSH